MASPPSNASSPSDASPQYTRTLRRYEEDREVDDNVSGLGSNAQTNLPVTGNSGMTLTPYDASARSLYYDTAKHNWFLETEKEKTRFQTFDDEFHENYPLNLPYGLS
jgi:hypothetical protein